MDLVEDRRATWDWLRKSVSGREFIYEVIDRNFDRLNAWTFIVQVPRDSSTPVIVRPRDAPAKRNWAGIDRKSIVFNKARRHPYRGKSYCKVSLADPTGKRTRLVALGRDPRHLPHWIDHFRSIMRIKKTVTTTRGTDENHQVFIVEPADHRQIIRIFFATKVWVLQERFMF